MLCTFLWGRSMGAVTTLLYTQINPNIAGIILDSPFSDLKELCKELVHNFIFLPRFLFSFLFNIIKNRIIAEANFNPEEISPIKFVSSCRMPVLFIVAKDDNFILPVHSEKLFES